MRRGRKQTGRILKPDLRMEGLPKCELTIDLSTYVSEEKATASKSAHVSVVKHEEGIEA